MGAYPMNATRNPSPAEMRPLICSLWVSDAIMLMPRRAMRKNSGGPKAKTMERTTGSRIRKIRYPKTDPRADAVAEMARAYPARPCRASGCPSKTVAMLATVPGTLSRMAEMEPPKVMPPMEAAKTIMASSGSRAMMIGSERVRMTMPPRPGSAPNSMLTVVPKSTTRMLGNRKTLTRATPRASITDHLFQGTPGHEPGFACCQDGGRGLAPGAAERKSRPAPGPGPLVKRPVHE